jgi:cell division protein ZapE
VSLAQRFESLLAEHGFTPDAAQRYAADRLDDLASRLVDSGRRPTPAFWNRWWKGPAVATRGIYLWGGVGRGKTMLVDLFAATTGARIQRLHFHHFMQAVHGRLKTLRQSARENPLATVAREFASQISVLCLDELYVSDIADAMILGTLFDAMSTHGITLVITSNVPPSGLYPDGLQRNRFLPTIALLENLTEVIEVEAGIDYRLRRLQKAPLYTLETDNSDERPAQRFRELAMSVGSGSGSIDVEGRQISYRQRHAGVIWFDFDALCRGPRGTDDYIAIAHQFHTVIVSGIPVLTGDDNAARRFIAFVDECYDRGVKLVLSAEAPIETLYQGEKLAFEYRRAQSRLTEMQSLDYLQLPHWASPNL